jgi:hypothetical protein
MHLVLGSLLVTGLAGPAAAEVGRNTDVLNPNQASVEQLVELPHITEAIAKQLHDAIPFPGRVQRVQAGVPCLQAQRWLHPLNPGPDRQSYLIPGQYNPHKW